MQCNTEIPIALPRIKLIFEGPRRCFEKLQSLKKKRRHSYGGSLKKVSFAIFQFDKSVILPGHVRAGKS